ncbi:MAG: TIGR04002 family protein [Clostridiales bacterium]|nr:TIGR04002 family protein [Clostridiales bacterium]
MSTNVSTKSRNNTSKNIKLLTMTALLAALVYVLTAFLHIPTNNGYTHVGDGVVFLAASMLPLPYAMAVGAIGAGLADTLSGFIIWLPATFIIKAVTSLYFTNKKPKILCLRNILAVIPAWLTCVAGYTLYEGTFISNYKAAIIALPSYTIQIVASMAVYILLSIGLDKIGFKKNFGFVSEK